MRMPVLTKTLLTTAVAATLSLGMASQVSAAPGVFEVTPAGALGATYAGFGSFNADQMFGNSSVLIEATTATNSTGTGWINFSAFSLLGSQLFASTTGLNLGPVGATNTYGLYLTFTEQSTITNGLPFGSPGSEGTLFQLDYELWADPGSDNTFTQANAIIPTNAAVTVNGTDIKLASGSLISGVAGINAAGGAHFNASTTIALTTDGENFFTDPVPFFDIAFNEFNNTSQGVVFNPTGGAAGLGLVAITQETGSVDFNRIPEPASVALVGLGLLGLFASRRKNAA